MSRLLFYALTAAFVVWLFIALKVKPAASEDPPPAPEVIEVDRTLQGRDVDGWHAVAERYLSRSRSLQRAIRVDPETSTAIGLACIVYGHCAELWRKAKCESNLWRYAHNPSGASGLFQFMPSTFAGTPFGRYSIYDPYANALAAGWMHARGRGGAWVCR